MMIGKLSVMLENHQELGEIFVIRANNNTGFVFDISGEHLILRVTKDSALLLSQFIEEELDVAEIVSEATH